MKAVKWIIVVVILAVVLFAGRSFFMGGDTRADQSVPYYERILTVERGDLEVTVSANGVVAPINRVEIKSKASGQIMRMPVEEGDIIHQGGLIAELDQTVARTELEQARADLMVADANLTQSDNNLTRAKELFEKRLISAEEHDRVQVEKVRAQSQLVRSRAQLQLAEERMDETIVRSPIEGILLTKDVEVGQIISSGVTTVGGGTLIATVADMEYVHVKANVDEVDIGRVVPGQKARIVADAYPNRIFIGEVIRVAPQGRTDQNITTFGVTVLVKNEGGLLKSGMSSDVELEIASRRNIVQVPNEALSDPSAMRENSGMQMAAANPTRMQATRQGDVPPARPQQEDSEKQPDGNNLNNRRVVMIKNGEEIEPRMVRVGISNFDYTEVTEGLNEGEVIVVRTLSRARQAGLEWQERMRGRSGFGGFGR
jgi:HlyD family secretion protein